MNLSGCLRATNLGINSPRTTKKNSTRTNEMTCVTEWLRVENWRVRRSVTKGSVTMPIATPIMVMPIWVPAINGERFSEILRISLALRLPFFDIASSRDLRIETSEYSPPTKKALPITSRIEITMFGATLGLGKSLLMVRYGATYTLSLPFLT